MKINDIDRVLATQKEFFISGKTLDVNFRIKMLKKLRGAILSHQDEINDALTQDLGKSAFEGFMCETGLSMSEISYLIKNVKRFARKKHVPTPITQFASVSYKQATPYGNTLIMSPWNYPFLLTIDPLADAIAAGNTAIVKPSAYSPATSAVIEKIVAEIFPENYVAVITGGREENAALLDKKFDFIFFTGSSAVGKTVLEKASKHLTPAVLELGGKSPCIVDETAKIKLAAKRIVFGKFLNCGQTCVAPDYILCHKSVRNALVEAIIAEIDKQYTATPLENAAYGKMVSKKHFDRVAGLIDKTKLIYGGQSDEETLKIAPTVVEANFSDAVMQEEIFGPVLPVITYDSLAEVYELLAERAKPLALYIFSENKKNIKFVTESLRFGGGCVNDTVIHLATSQLGFGGVGESGMGQYHGRDGFEAFSHTKNILDKKTWMDLPMRYQPYKKLYGKLLHLFLR